MLSGSYPESPTSGVPFQLFSEDLDGGLVSNGRRCRSSAPEACPVENPPLPGSEAPAGYRNYYLRYRRRQLPGGPHRAPTSATFSSAPRVRSRLRRRDARPRAHRHLDLRGARPAAPPKSPAAAGECDPKRNRTSTRSPAPNCGRSTPPRAPTLAAQSRAISTDGSRVYWTDGANLYLRDGAVNKQVDNRKVAEAGPSRPPAPTARSPTSRRRDTSTATWPAAAPSKT